MPTQFSTAVNASALSSSMFLLWAGFILVSLNMRLIFATLGPVMSNLQLGDTSKMLVTTLPLLLLGVFSLIGVKLRHILGKERAVFVAMLLLALGCSARWFGETALIIGTIFGSAGIAVMNVLMPALAKKRFGYQRMGLVMGIYALMLGVGAALGASASFPLFKALGADTPAAYHMLGLWSLPAVLALIVWLPQLAHQPAAAGHYQSTGKAVNVYKNPMAWSMTLFFGLQALNLYVFLPWMTSMLMERGSAQPAAASLFAWSQVSLMFSSFLLPYWAGRCQDHRGYIALTILTCLAGTLGLYYAPLNTALIWALLLGFGQGAGPSLAAYLFVAKSGSIDTATRVSSMAQTIGYLIGTAGLLLIGAIYRYTGNWNAPILLLAGILVVQLFMCLPAGRDVKV